MSFDSLYASRIEENIDRWTKAPGPAGQASSFSAWSTIAAGGKAVPAAAIESLGSISDIGSLFPTGEAGQISFDPPKPGTFSPFLGDALRRKADTFMPDPQTSSTADQVVAGLVKGVTKAATDIAVAGPIAGAVAFGAEEGNTAGQKLRMEGVDTATAAKVGAVTGVANALGAVIPMGGSTLLRTAALAGVAGPGTFMAQEALSRKILADAGAKDQASLHDPLDPLGLSLATIIPFGFGALHLRNVKKIEPIVAPKTDAEIAAGIRLTPQEQAHSDVYERSAANLQELQQTIAKEKRPEVKALLQAEFDKQSAAATKALHDDIVPHASADPDIIDAARVKVTNAALHENLPDFPQAHAEVMRASDELAAGRFPDIAPPPTIRSEAEVQTAAQAHTADPVASRLPEPSQLGSPRTPTIDEMQALSRVEPVPLDKTVSFQSARQWDKFAAGDHPGDIIPGYGDKPVALRLESGEYVIHDGNHRTDLARRAGEKTLDMHVIDVKSYDPEVAGRKPPKASAAELDDLAAQLGLDSTPTPRPVARPQSEGTNALPRADSPTLEPKEPSVAPEKSTTGPTPPSADSMKAAALAETNPDLRVVLPGAAEDSKPMSVQAALDAVKEQADHDAGWADLVKAASDCALSYG